MIKLAILTITPNGQSQALKIKTLITTIASVRISIANTLTTKKAIRCDCYTSDTLLSVGFLGFDGQMSTCVARLFREYEALLFICATGITVRMIAPLVCDKLSDPAILVMDEQGHNVISLLSGHVGHANALTLEIAALIGANPVITTATDVNQKASLDVMAQALDANIEAYRTHVKMINQMLVSNKRVGLWVDREIIIEDTRGFILIDCLEKIDTLQLDALVIISIYNIDISISIPIVRVVPKRVVMGIGCRKNIQCNAIYPHLMKQLNACNLHPLSMKSMGSILLKAHEQGLIDLSERLNIPFTTYSVAVLKAYEHHFPHSAWVEKTVGIGSVSEPVAWHMSQGNLIGTPFKQDGMTITLGVITCCIS